MSLFKVKLPILAVCLLVLSLIASCAPPPDNLDSRISRATASYHFSLMGWEVKSLWGEFTQVFRRQPAGDNITAREKLLEARVREAFAEQGIYNPVSGLKVSFPPVNISLGAPPYLLIISPRDLIKSIRTVTLLPDMDEKEMEAIEDDIENLDYSALVVKLGGMATFPSYVSDDADTRFIIETTAHEWVHQYLAFTPLGFLYVLDSAGIRRDYDVATMNETVADIVGREIGDAVYQKYYAPPETNYNAPKTATTSFDFNATMRETRKTVDSYLAAGKIDAAEAFMEQQRQYLNAHGYNIRKLNQAYFAFYGSYADSPTSISPIGAGIKQLRKDSASLKDFLDRVQTYTSAQQLADNVQENIAK